MLDKTANTHSLEILVLCDLPHRVASPNMRWKPQCILTADNDLRVSCLRPRQSVQHWSATMLLRDASKTETVCYAYEVGPPRSRFGVCAVTRRRQPPRSPTCL